MSFLRHLRWITILVIIEIVMLLSMCSVPGDDTSKQKHTIESFYRLIITEKFSEIPDSSHIDILKPYISLQLQKLLFDARNAEDVIAGNETEPVPPVIEGSLFTSLFEGPDSLTEIKADSVTGNAFWVELEYKNTAVQPGADTTFKWNDRVYLVKEKGTWVINDIELLGKWAFSRKTKVTSILKEVIALK